MYHLIIADLIDVRSSNLDGLVWLAAQYSRRYPSCTVSLTTV